MKFLGKKVPKGNFLLFLSFTVISLCFLLVLSTIRAEKENNIKMKNMYTGHQKSFSIINSDDDEQWTEVMPDIIEAYDNFAVYVPVHDDEILMRGLYINGEVLKPPIISGKYFDKATSWTDEPKIVLGKNYENDVYENGGKKYYKYCGQVFEVMGIMGTKEESRLNNMAFIDFKSALGITGINTGYILDTKEESDIMDIGSRISDDFDYPADVGIILPGGDGNSGIAEFLSGKGIMDTLYIMVLVSFSLSTLLVVFIWFRHRKGLFFAWKLCGYKEYSVFAEIAKKFYLTAGVSYCVGLGLMSVISVAAKDITIAVPDVLKSFIMTIGLGTIILILCYLLDKKARS